MTSALGWVFAVGAGRRVDYRVIAAPDFLVEGLEYGVLGDMVHPSSDQRIEVVRTTMPIGGPLTIVYSTQAVTGQDIAGSEDSGAVGDLQDEQNRPLRLIVGFVIRGHDEPEPDAADVAAARVAALNAYRTFLADEVGFEVVPTSAFRLASTIAGRLESCAPTQPLSLATSSRGQQLERVSIGPRQGPAERSRTLSGQAARPTRQPTPGFDRGRRWRAASPRSAARADRRVGRVPDLRRGLAVAQRGGLPDGHCGANHGAVEPSPDGHIAAAIDPDQHHRDNHRAADPASGWDRARRGLRLS